MKKIAILYSEYTPLIDALKYKLSDYSINYFNDTCEFDNKDFDLVILANYNGEVNFNAINIHHSLLPSFSGSNPLKQAIEFGAKITGITIYYTQTNQIIAQYPVFLTGDKHFDEIEQELNYLSITLYPLIIEKLINNEQFDIQELLGKKSCCGGCSGCVH